VLAAGAAEGDVVVLTEPLSFWGGYDPQTGQIIDARHPQRGVSLAGKVVLMPGGRGSSSSSAVLAEAIRAGSSPVGIVLRDADTIVALGAIVAEELYGRRCPVVVVGADAFLALATAGRLRVEAENGIASVRAASD
jgi:predicted aconitase with swiveling domain